MEREKWDTLAKRVKELRKERKLNQEQLAEAAGMSQSDISKIERGDMLQTTKIAQLARALKCDAYWLATGDGDLEIPHLSSIFAAQEPRTEFQPVRPGKMHQIPVLGQGAGGSLPERIWTDGDFPVGATNEYADVASSDPHAFIVKVVGPSMIPRYNPGEYALVEPGTSPELEDDVLVRLADGQTVLKQILSRRGGYVRLHSYNPAHEDMHIPQEEITWMYYVAYPVPARKIKSRV